MRIALLTTDNRQDSRDYSRPAPWFGTAPEALLQGFEELPEAEVHVVTCTQHPVSAPKKLADNIYFHSLIVPKIGWLRTGYQGCVRAVRRKLRQLSPDIVHGQGTERDCAISAVLSGFPNVITIHGNMRLIAQVNRAPKFSFQGLTALLERWTIPRSNGVVCITDYTRRAVMDLARRTWVVPNAVDASFFDIARKRTATKKILCVGVISARKNQNRLIEALDSLARTTDFELRFLGGAPQHDYSRRFFELLRTRAWCHYDGIADRAQLRDFLADASALVLPSLEDNCPMVVLEAMAARVPVAAARVGGVPELVEDGRTALLFDPEKNEQIAAACGRLIDDSALARMLTESGKQEARERFHPAQIARQHLNIYRELLSSRS